MNHDADLLPEEVYPAFVQALGVETGPGVIEVDDVDGIVEIHAEPDDIVAMAYLEFDVSADLTLDIVPRSPHPRRLGLAYLMDDVEAKLRSRTPEEHYLVADDGWLQLSTRAALPVVQGPADGGEAPVHALAPELEWSQLP